MKARTTCLNALAIFAIAFGMSSSHYLDRDAHEHHAQGHGYAVDSASALAHARAQAQRRYRQELQAMAQCAGENSTVIWYDDLTHGCATKRGHISRTVHKVAP